MKKTVLFICIGIGMSSCTSVTTSSFGFSQKKIELPETKKIEVELSKTKKDEKKVFIPEVDIIDLKNNVLIEEAPKNKNIKIDDKENVDISKKTIKEGKAYKKGTDTPFTGMFVLKLGTHLQYTEQYVEGKLSGLKTWYSEAGLIGMTEEYKDGYLNGTKKAYYRDTGKLKVQIPYEKGLIDGEMISYSKTGAIISKESFQNGTGEWRIYWNNGKMKEEGSLNSGRKEGLWRYYNKDGELEKITNYKYGRIIKNEWLD